jgi:hypothetical protein
MISGVGEVEMVEDVVLHKFESGGPYVSVKVTKHSKGITWEVGVTKAESVDRLYIWSARLRPSCACGMASR